MAIELTTKFLPLVDEQFAMESKKSLLTNQDFDWNGAKSIKVYRITTADMNDYGRGGASGGNWSRYGAVDTLDASTQEMTLRQDRSFTFALDKMDGDETQQQLAAASALARQLREVAIPEIDSYVYSEMCENAGTVATPTALTATNIYDKIIEANKVLDDAFVPEVGRYLVVTPAVYLLMKKSKDITMETDIGADMRLKGVIGMIDGLSVIKVPESRLPLDFGFMLAHSVATVCPTKLEDFTIHQNPPGISGTLVEGRIVYDTFVLDNKKLALFYQPQA